MDLRLSVDRVENGIAVCYDDNDKKYELLLDGVSEGDIISVSFDTDGSLLSVNRLENETEARRSELASRTKNLFKTIDIDQKFSYNTNGILLIFNIDIKIKGGFL